MPPYRNPPLVEAIYEVFVQDAPGWSQLSAAHLEQSLSASYSGQREVLESVNLDIHLGPTGKPDSTVAPQASRIRLWTADRSSLVRFGSQMAALNVLSAYSGYEAQAPHLRAFFDAYIEASRPTKLAWVGQRYVNKIVLPAGAPEASTYFQLYPRLPAATPHRTFALQVVSDSFDGGEVVMSLLFQGQSADRPIYFLDIYARSTREIAPNTQEIVRWQSAAHEAVRRSFSMALTDACRELFQEVT